MRETSRVFGTKGVLSFTGSFVHQFTSFPERRAGNVFDELRVRERAVMRDRYNVSILIALLFVRELVGKIREEENRGGWIGDNGGGGSGGRKGENEMVI